MIARAGDPGAEPTAILAAARWVESALLGTTATLVAIIAVAGLGYLLFTGRIDVRRGATVVLGCFILFGAPVIARGLYGLTTLSFVASPAVVEPVQSAPVPAPTSTPNRLPAYDPYAGASVPQR